jgi:hypothetical protein
MFAVLLLQSATPAAPASTPADGLSLPGQSFVILASVFILIFVIGLVRRRWLSEKLSLFWLTFALLMLAAASFGYPFLIHGAKLIGIVYPPSALFLMAILFLLGFTLYLSVALSKLTDQNKTLAQEVALLRQDQERQASERR